MDSPIRLYQKQKDYQRHKLFRKIKRRRERERKNAINAPIKELRRRMKQPVRFRGGKDQHKEKKYGYDVEYMSEAEAMKQLADNMNKAAVMDEVVVTPSRRLPMQSELSEGITNQAANERADAYANATAPTAMDIFNIGTLGGLNNLSPAQWARRAYDLGQAINGNMTWDKFGNDWFYGNNGLVSDEYAKNNPLMAAGINLFGDLGAFGTVSALRQLPKLSAAMLAENRAAQKAAALNWDDMFANGTRIPLHSDNAPDYNNLYHELKTAKPDRNLLYVGEGGESTVYTKPGSNEVIKYRTGLGNIDTLEDLAEEIKYTLLQNKLPDMFPLRYEGSFVDHVPFYETLKNGERVKKLMPPSFGSIYIQKRVTPLNKVTGLFGPLDRKALLKSIGYGSDYGSDLYSIKGFPYKIGDLGPHNVGFDELGNFGLIDPLIHYQKGKDKNLQPPRFQKGTDDNRVQVTERTYPDGSVRYFTGDIELEPVNTMDTDDMSMWTWQEKNRPHVTYGLTVATDSYNRGKDIHIKPSERGTFTAAAKKRGMSVQQFASKVLKAPKGKYSTSMRKKANFAKNASKWKK